MAEEPHVLEGDKDMATTTDIQNQSQSHKQLEAKGRLKSKIVCNNQLLEEAQQLWDFGNNHRLGSRHMSLVFYSKLCRYGGQRRK